MRCPARPTRRSPGLTTAARIGAILDLTWGRIDFERGNINLRLPDGVTRKGRAVVAMNRMARAALEAAYQARLSDYVIEFGGKPVGSIRTGFNAAVRRAGIGRAVGVHDLRHTAAVKMLSMGIPMEQVSQFLAHSNVQTTRRVYARFAPEHLADAAAVLEFTDTPRAVRKVR
ncbi:tyrosine-type recombinase/integrase [Jannaschia faecimaris]|nr:site-specific integrase [Jannaschia faecimaris]